MRGYSAGPACRITKAPAKARSRLAGIGGWPARSLTPLRFRPLDTPFQPPYKEPYSREPSPYRPVTMEFEVGKLVSC